MGRRIRSGLSARGRPPARFRLPARPRPLPHLRPPARPTSNHRLKEPATRTELTKRIPKASPKSLSTRRRLQSRCRIALRPTRRATRPRPARLRWKPATRRGQLPRNLRPPRRRLLRRQAWTRLVTRVARSQESRTPPPKLPLRRRSRPKGWLPAAGTKVQVLKVWRRSRPLRQPPRWRRRRPHPYRDNRMRPGPDAATAMAQSSRR